MQNGSYLNKSASYFEQRRCAVSNLVQKYLTTRSTADPYRFCHSPFQHGFDTLIVTRRPATRFIFLSIKEQMRRSKSYFRHFTLLLFLIFSFLRLCLSRTFFPFLISFLFFVGPFLFLSFFVLISFSADCRFWSFLRFSV
jgi:hypothetical protein